MHFFGISYTSVLIHRSCWGTQSSSLDNYPDGLPCQSPLFWHHNEHMLCSCERTLQLMCSHFILIYHGCTTFVAAVHHLHWAFAFVFMEMFKGASPSTAASVWASGVQLMDNGLQCQIAGRLGYAEKTPVHRAGSSSSRHCSFQMTGSRNTAKLLKERIMIMK